MQRRLLLVGMIVACAANALAGEFVPASTGIEFPSVLARHSILRGSVVKTDTSRRSWFSLRSQLGSGRQIVRLVSDDEAGTAYYVGIDPNSPDGEEGPVPLPAPGPDDDKLSPKDLKSQAVPLDGAAKKAEAEEDDDDDEDKLATQRSSFGWIAGTGNGLGMLEWTSRDLAVLDYSAADRASFQLNTGHAFTWLTGPDTTDLPPYLFSLFVEASAGIKAGDDWSFDVVISPSWNTDFANKSYQLFRLPWQAVNTFRLNDEWKLVAGVTDLDREDIKFLPVAGVIYRPLDGSKDFNLVFPRPKAAWRLSRAEDGCHWGYVSGELGGNSYSIQRPGAVHDIVTLRDYRLLVGWERRGKNRHACRLEAGWVFGRAVEYLSGIGDYNPGQTAILRLSTDY